MTSARDLLLQADALMRSNRSVGATDPDESVPLLTDVVLPGSEGISFSQRRIANAVSAPANAVDLARTGSPTDYPYADSSGQTVTASILGQPSVFRDTTMPVASTPSVATEGAVTAIADPIDAAPAGSSPAADAPTDDPLLVGVRPFGLAEANVSRAVPEEDPPIVPLISPEEMLPPMPPLEEIPAAPTQSAVELAESVYYQVLQNLDLFTEQALQRELTLHLAPIIERANHELLATLHANLGGLLRQFIADAIEKQLGVRPDTGDTAS